jgi:thiol-disulfide isomerase/thioredoxin
MKFNVASVVTLVVMTLIIAGGAVYLLFFVDESEVQKRDNTPAAQALLIGEGEESFTDLSGNALSVSDYFGKVLVVTSWASWCPQCTQSLPELGTISEEYKERGVVVIAMNRAEDQYTAERFLNTITIPPSLVIILDPGDHYFGASTGYAMPETPPTRQSSKWGNPEPPR